MLKTNNLDEADWKGTATSGSNRTPCTNIEPTNVNLVNFALWLRRKGNRDSTIERKLKYLKGLKGSPEQMFVRILAMNWSDKSKECAL